MKDTPQDYSKLDELMKSWGFTPITDQRGRYYHHVIGLDLVDLTSIRQDEASIMREILNQTMAVGMAAGMEQVQQTIRRALNL